MGIRFLGFSLPHVGDIAGLIGMHDLIYFLDTTQSQKP